MAKKKTTSKSSSRGSNKGKSTRSKPRQIRSDITIGNLEKKLGLEPGAIRNPDGSDARSDKKLGTLRAEYAKTVKNRSASKGKRGK